MKCHQDFLPNHAHHSLSWCSHTTRPSPQLSVIPPFTHGPWSLKGIQHPCNLAVSTHCSDDLSSTHHTPSHPLAPLTELNLTVPQMFQRLISHLCSCFSHYLKCSPLVHFQNFPDCPISPFPLFWLEKKAFFFFCMRNPNYILSIYKCKHIRSYRVNNKISPPPFQACFWKEYL